jgi:hypothetical protein
LAPSTTPQNHGRTPHTLPVPYLVVSPFTNSRAVSEQVGGLVLFRFPHEILIYH